MGFEVITANGSLKEGSIFPTEYTTTTTGNIDDLDFSNADLIRMNNASLSTIRGLKAGSAGQQVTIVSIGAGQVDLAHQNTNSAVANRLINTVTGFSTPLAAGVGAATYQYDGTTARWRLVEHSQGAPISIAYSAGDYLASTGTWTVDSGDVATYKYFLHGTTATFYIQIQDTSVSATPTSLTSAIPTGMVFAKTARVPFIYQDAGGGNTVGLLSAISGDSKLSYSKLTGSWSIATNTTAVFGQLQTILT